ncbi:MAG: hypothetical protein QM831_43670 [Kofleriaceae bacterium]
MRWLVFLAACGGVPDNLEVAHPTKVEHLHVDNVCADIPPVGTPDQFTKREVPGFKISAPQTCEAGTYIRIERLSGTSTLGSFSKLGSGLDQGCMDLADWNACKVSINVGALLMQVNAELKRDKIETANTGAGPCSTDLNTYAGWNFSTGVHDWKDADKLVGKITELMDRYDIVGYTGASVYAIPCGVAD